jgi:hypothetical protein
MTTETVWIKRKSEDKPDPETYEWAYNNSDGDRECVLWSSKEDQDMLKLYIPGHGCVPLYVQDIPLLIEALDGAYNKATTY